MISFFLFMVLMDYFFLRLFMLVLRYEQFSCVFDFVVLFLEIIIVVIIFYVKILNEVENKKEVKKK